MRSGGAWQREQLVSQFARAALDEFAQLGAHGLFQRRLLVALEGRPPESRCAVAGVVRAVAPPALEVLGRGQGRPPEALPEALERVLRAQEVAARPDLGVGRERERVLVEGDGRELPAQELQQLDV